MSTAPENLTLRVTRDCVGDVVLVKEILKGIQCHGDWKSRVIICVDKPEGCAFDGIDLCRVQSTADLNKRCNLTGMHLCTDRCRKSAR